jgi:hypothetical protein
VGAVLGGLFMVEKLEAIRELGMIGRKSLEKEEFRI